MNRGVIAAAALAVLLLGCAANWHAMQSVTRELDAPLAQAIDAAEQDDLPGAARLIAQSQAEYIARERYLSAVCSEKLLDEVRLSYARAQAAAQGTDAAQLLPELFALRQAIDDLLRTERFGLGNLLTKNPRRVAGAW